MAISGKNDNVGAELENSKMFFLANIIGLHSVITTLLSTPLYHGEARIFEKTWKENRLFRASLTAHRDVFKHMYNNNLFTNGMAASSLANTTRRFLRTNTLFLLPSELENMGYSREYAQHSANLSANVFNFFMKSASLNINNKLFFQERMQAAGFREKVSYLFNNPMRGSLSLAVGDYIGMAAFYGAYNIYFGGRNTKLTIQDASIAALYVSAVVVPINGLANFMGYVARNPEIEQNQNLRPSYLVKDNFKFSKFCEQLKTISKFNLGNIISVAKENFNFKEATSKFITAFIARTPFIWNLSGIVANSINIASGSILYAYCEGKIIRAPDNNRDRDMVQAHNSTGNEWMGRIKKQQSNYKYFSKSEAVNNIFR